MTELSGENLTFFSSDSKNVKAYDKYSISEFYILLKHGKTWFFGALSSGLKSNYLLFFFLQKAETMTSTLAGTLLKRLENNFS